MLSEQCHPHNHTCFSGDPFRLSTGQIIGIVIGILIVIVCVILFIHFYIKPRWPQRHQYGWYNTQIISDIDCHVSTCIQRTSVEVLKAKVCGIYKIHSELDTE